MSDEIEEIIEHYRRDDPEDPDFYTREWVAEECAYLQRSPSELLAQLRKYEAIALAAAAITEDQPWTKDLPEHYKDKLSGPIDALSYELMTRRRSST